MNPQAQHLPEPPARPSQPQYTPSLQPQQAGQPLALQQSTPDLATPSSDPALDISIPNEVEVDKSWIDKTHDLVSMTRDDPYLQSKELAKLRSEYLKARFEKQSKIAEQP